MVPKSQRNPSEGTTQEMRRWWFVLLFWDCCFLGHTKPNSERKIHSNLDPTQLWEGRGWRPSRVKGRVGGLTRASGSDLWQVVIHHDYTGPVTAVQLLLPTLRFLYLHFETFSLIWILRNQGSGWVFWDFMCNFEQPGVFSFAACYLPFFKIPWTEKCCSLSTTQKHNSVQINWPQNLFHRNESIYISAEVNFPALLSTCVGLPSLF